MPKAPSLCHSSAGLALNCVSCILPWVCLNFDLLFKFDDVGSFV